MILKGLMINIENNSKKYYEVNDMKEKIEILKNVDLKMLKLSLKDLIEKIN